MKYDESTCFWCGKNIENQKAFYSLRTDTLYTRRSFCTREHLEKFKDYMSYQQMLKRPIKAYKGRTEELNVT